MLVRLRLPLCMSQVATTFVQDSDCGYLCAGGAGAVDEELVAGVLEAARELGFGLDCAAFEFVDGSADVALEVMVMRFAGHFVAGGVAWNLDRREPFVF